MKPAILIFALLLSIGLTLPADDSAALAELRAIPSAKASLEGPPTVVVVTSEGVSVNGAEKIPFDDVLQALANLPRGAWTHGRAVTFFPFPPGLSSADDQPTPAEVKEVETELESAGIKLVGGASA